MPGFSIFLVLFLGFNSLSMALDCRRGESGTPILVNEIASEIEKGSVVFLGELHGFKEVAEGQLQILQALRQFQHSLMVAFEFFPYSKQKEVDQYREGLMPEADFLEAIGWGKLTNFDFYRPQALFPDYRRGERTLAINASRTLTGAIAKRGLDGLTEEEKALLPPNFEVGRESYLERFRQVMGDHADEPKILRYFQAQSVWDDTMAWVLAGHQSDHTKVVVVGEFHVQYGGGLPHRLAVRDPQRPIVIIGFVNKQGLSSEEIDAEIRPHQSWGIRENYICLVDLPPVKQD